MTTTTSRPQTKVEVYQDSIGQHRWRAIAANGEIIADSAEAYTRRWSARRAARRTWPFAHIIYT